ncbi:hypothetical protein P8A24_02365 [Arcanobacterium wilhelmae]|uniref:hypothetical protein n=1 Tax=Arcanobacterium wilhelmae TaxID=1803177 RepID=UPI002415567D|nr:hypothetical protein [Arcanobacterium wilhelmae]WFN90718.1 hypothetical protein P8A24_02365 [Arcanobacterium wilhelmae]
MIYEFTRNAPLGYLLLPVKEGTVSKRIAAGAAIAPLSDREGDFMVQWYDPDIATRFYDWDNPFSRFHVSPKSFTEPMPLDNQIVLTEGQFAVVVVGEGSHWCRASIHIVLNGTMWRFLETGGSDPRYRASSREYILLSPESPGHIGAIVVVDEDGFDLQCEPGDYETNPKLLPILTPGVAELLWNDGFMHHRMEATTFAPVAPGVRPY